MKFFPPSPLPRSPSNHNLGEKELRWNISWAQWASGLRFMGCSDRYQISDRGNKALAPSPGSTEILLLFPRMLVGVKPRIASQHAQTCHACNWTYRQVRSQELFKVLPRELSLLICRRALLWAHCTVYFQSDVVGFQDSAGWMNC